MPVQARGTNIEYYIRDARVGGQIITDNGLFRSSSFYQGYGGFNFLTTSITFTDADFLTSSNVINFIGSGNGINTYGFMASSIFDQGDSDNYIFSGAYLAGDGTNINYFGLFDYRTIYDSGNSPWVSPVSNEFVDQTNLGSNYYGLPLSTSRGWYNFSFDFVQFMNAAALYRAGNSAPLFAILDTKTYDYVGDNAVSNEFHGYALNDTIRGGALVDILSGWGGNDSIQGAGGDDDIYGDGGGDTLGGGIGDDLVNGGDGDDYIIDFLGQGEDTFIGGAGDDILHFRDLGTAGVVIDTRTPYLNFAGNVAWTGIEEIWGTENNDFIYLTDEGNVRDTIHGWGGHDQLGGGDGKDQIYGDEGNDDLRGWLGSDWLFGGSGTDFLHGEQGDDWLFGEGDVDQLFGGSGNDYLVGGWGNDILDGGFNDLDFAVYTSVRSEYRVYSEFIGGQFITRVFHELGSDGFDTLLDVEGLYFADMIFNETPTVLRPLGIQQNKISAMDGERFDDVLLQNSVTGQVIYQNMQGAAGTGFQNILIGMPAGWKAFSSADMTEDGRAETFLHDANTGSIYFHNNLVGSTTWTLVTTGFTSNFQPIATGDVTRDGFADVLVRNNTTGELFIGDINEGGVFGGFLGLPNVGAGWRTVGLGDFNGDAASDILIQNIADGTTYYWDTINSAFGVVSTNIGAAWVAKEAADLNGDGWCDVIFRNASNGNIWYRNMLGGTGGNWGTIANGLTGWDVRATADVENDGYRDVIIQNTSDGTTYYADMDGGVFTKFGVVTGAVGTSWLVV